MYNYWETEHGLVCAIMINPPELQIIDETRNKAHCKRY